MKKVTMITSWIVRRLIGWIGTLRSAHSFILDCTSRMTYDRQNHKVPVPVPLHTCLFSPIHPINLSSSPFEKEDMWWLSGMTNNDRWSKRKVDNHLQVIYQDEVFCCSSLFNPCIGQRLCSRSSSEYYRLWY
jgi:hypothetical protein